MKKIIFPLFALIAVLSLAALKPSPVANFADAREDSLAADRAKYVKQVKDAIAGKEKMPAGEVFKNVKIFKTQTAEQMLGIMEQRWSKTLGVSCGHCHNTNDFSSEEKNDFKIARDMVAMVGKINDDLLATMPAYASKERKPRVCCNTFHRGESHPGRPNK